MKPDVYWIDATWPGRLAILARPRGDDWLADEIEGWETAGLDVVVSLLTTQENSDLGLLNEEAITRRKGLTFISFPIADYSVPSSQESTRNLVMQLDELLLSGRKIGIHCRQGIGRSSLVAVCVLASAGVSADDGFECVRNARGVSVPDTREQREWVTNFTQVLLTNANQIR